MLCKSCGFENSVGMNFCGKCASPLVYTCPQCGFENPPDFAFCSNCAAPLVEQTSTSQTTQIDRQPGRQKDKTAREIPIPTERKSRDAERRQLTVMFCDMVGSTALSEQLDPEDLREVMLSYQEVCEREISRFGGHIAKYLGDGLLVYFGYPKAHEDDAQRSARTGLEIVRAIRDMPQQNKMKKLALQVRIGIHTGLVVAGEMGAGEVREKMAIVGETPNIAARLQGLAEPNTVVISAPTYRLVEGLFECHDLGLQTLKGVSNPVEVYEVLYETEVQSRFEVAITKGLTPLVGREQEVGLLLERWERVKEGMGQVVFLTGEAGIGKSRLVQVMKDRVSQEQHARIESRCSPHYQNTALYPVIDHLQRLLQFKREDHPEEKLGKLEEILTQYGFPLEEMVPLFASLFSLPLPDGYPPLNLTPQMQR